MTEAVPLPHRHTPGTVRAAFSYRDYRLMWIGGFLSGFGTWMQNVALPAYIQHRTHSAGYVGLIGFGQLGPVLFLSIPGGVLAAKFPRRPYLLFMQGVQLVGSLLLAVLVSRDASVIALFWCNTLVGVGNALTAPGLQSVVPMLVDRRDLPGAISMNSTQMNAARVSGPLIAGLLALGGVTIAQIFVINAFTYVAMMVAIVVIKMPKVPDRLSDGWRGLTEGLRIARAKPQVGRILVTLATFSFLSLAFIGLYPTIVDVAFGIDPTSATYKWLYAVWGLGALMGGLSAGTLLARRDKAQLVRPALIGFAVFLVIFSQLRSAPFAFPVGFLLGWCYFLIPTSMLTVLQLSITDSERSYVMSLWFMGFGGMVTVGALVFGPVVDSVGPRWLMVAGALWALFLSWWCDLSGSRVERSRQVFQAGDPAALDQHGAVAGE